MARAIACCLCVGGLTVAAVARLLRGRSRLPADRPLRVLVTGTFHNRGWLRAHARPIADAVGVESLVIVTDAPLDPLPKTAYACPPEKMIRLLGRTPARLLQVGISAWRERSDVLVGYHILPNAAICLVVAALLGRRAVYQMTGGPVEVAGGGGRSENALLRHVGVESPLLERLLLRLAARFDAVVVRGERAVAYLAERGITRGVTVIPGGIDVTTYAPSSDERRHDLIFVGRLVPAKGCDLLQEVVIRLAKRRPGIRAVVLGDGPLREVLATAFEAAGVARNVEMPGQRNDVHAWVGRSRVFLLTSPSEGLSIALLEAMTAGCVPVVSDVGELADVVRDGETGFLVASRQPDDYVERVLEILDDGPRRESLAQRAREVARRHAGLEAVSARWEALLDRLVQGGAPAPEIAGPPARPSQR